MNELKECASMFADGDYSALSVKDGEMINVCGIISEKKEKITKSGQMMAFLNIEDMTGALRVVLFPKTLKECEDYTSEDTVVMIRGRINYRDDGTGEMMAESLSPVKEISSEPMILEIDDAAVLDKINPYVRKSKGDVPLFIEFGGKTIQSVYLVNRSDELVKALDSAGCKVK